MPLSPLDFFDEQGHIREETGCATHESFRQLSVDQILDLASAACATITTEISSFALSATLRHPHLIPATVCFAVHLHVLASERVLESPTSPENARLYSVISQLESTIFTATFPNPRNPDERIPSHHLILDYLDAPRRPRDPSIASADFSYAPPTHTHVSSTTNPIPYLPTSDQRLSLAFSLRHVLNDAGNLLARPTADVPAASCMVMLQSAIYTRLSSPLAAIGTWTHCLRQIVRMASDAHVPLSHLPCFNRDHPWRASTLVQGTASQPFGFPLVCALSERASDLWDVDDARAACDALSTVRTVPCALPIDLRIVHGLSERLVRQATPGGVPATIARLIHLCRWCVFLLEWIPRTPSDQLPARLLADIAYALLNATSITLVQRLCFPGSLDDVHQLQQLFLHHHISVESRFIQLVSIFMSDHISVSSPELAAHFPHPFVTTQSLKRLLQLWAQVDAQRDSTALYLSFASTALVPALRQAADAPARRWEILAHSVRAVEELRIPLVTEATRGTGTALRAASLYSMVPAVLCSSSSSSSSDADMPGTVQMMLDELEAAIKVSLLAIGGPAAVITRRKRIAGVAAAAMNLPAITASSSAAQKQEMTTQILAAVNAQDAVNAERVLCSDARLAVVHQRTCELVSLRLVEQLIINTTHVGEYVPLLCTWLAACTSETSPAITTMPEKMSTMLRNMLYQVFFDMLQATGVLPPSEPWPMEMSIFARFAAATVEADDVPAAMTLPPALLEIWRTHPISVRHARDVHPQPPPELAVSIAPVPATPAAMAAIPPATPHLAATSSGPLTQAEARKQATDLLAKAQWTLTDAQVVGKCAQGMKEELEQNVVGLRQRVQHVQQLQMRAWDQVPVMEDALMQLNLAIAVVHDIVATLNIMTVIRVA